MALAAILAPAGVHRAGASPPGPETVSPGTPPVAYVAVATRGTLILFPGPANLPGAGAQDRPIGESRRLVPPLSGGEIWEIALAPLGDRLYGVSRSPCVRGRQAVQVFGVELATGATHTVRTIDSACEGEGLQHITALVPSPSGDRVAWALTGVDWSGWEMARWDGRTDLITPAVAEERQICAGSSEFYGGWPLLWSLDGRQLFAFEFRSNGNAVECVYSVDVREGRSRLVFAYESTAERRRDLRGTPAALDRAVPSSARGVYGLAGQDSGPLLEPLGSGLRRPKRLWSPDGRWQVRRDWGDLVFSDASGQEAWRIPAAVPAPPLCGEVCVDPDDLWTVSWLGRG